MATNQQALGDMKHQRGHGLRRGDTFVAPLDGRSHVSGDRSQAAAAQDHSGAVCRDRQRRYGPRDAAVFVEQDKRFTWDELAEAVDALAAGLLALGLKKGDRIGIWSPNRWEWLVTQFATARIGLVLVNINPAYRLTELEYALNKVGCRALISAVRFKTSDYLGMIETLAPELATAEPGRLKAARLPNLQYRHPHGRGQIARHVQFRRCDGDGRRATSTSASTRSRQALKPGDAVNIQFTSGTTGAPKGATLTHDNIVNNANFVTAAMNFGRRRPALHSGAALSLLRHGDGHAGLRHQGRHHGISGRRLRSAARR